jgi:predicted ribonuclease toxin of YeeF-YezG toxin-antitoxin module
MGIAQELQEKKAKTASEKLKTVLETKAKVKTVNKEKKAETVKKNEAKAKVVSTAKAKAVVQKKAIVKKVVVETEKKAIKKEKKDLAKGGSEAKISKKLAGNVPEKHRIGVDALLKMKKTFTVGEKTRYLGRNKDDYGKNVEIKRFDKDPRYGIYVKFADGRIVSVSPMSLG